MNEFQVSALIAIVSFIGGVFFALTMGWVEGSDEDER
jgi:hypothetical protein